MCGGLARVETFRRGRYFRKTKGKKCLEARHVFLQLLQGFSQFEAVAPADGLVMRFLDVVIGDAVADPDADAASVFDMILVHPPILRLAPHVVEDDVDAVRIDEV